MTSDDLKLIAACLHRTKPKPNVYEGNLLLRIRQWESDVREIAASECIRSDTYFNDDRFCKACGLF